MKQIKDISLDFFNNENISDTGKNTTIATEARTGYQTGAFGNNDNILNSNYEIEKQDMSRKNFLEQVDEMIVEVDLADELKPGEVADCKFCCKQTFKACTNCYNHVLVWIIITGLAVTSFVQLMEGILYLMVINGALRLATIRAINTSNNMPTLSIVLPFYIIIPIQLITWCCIWTILLVRKKSKQGYGTGLNAVFAVPSNYQFTNDVEKVDPTLSVTV